MRKILPTLWAIVKSSENYVSSENYIIGTQQVITSHTTQDKTVLDLMQVYSSRNNTELVNCDTGCHTKVWAIEHRRGWDEFREASWRR